MINIDLDAVQRVKPSYWKRITKPERQKISYHSVMGDPSDWLRGYFAPLQGNTVYVVKVVKQERRYPKYEVMIEHLQDEGHKIVSTFGNAVDKTAETVERKIKRRVRDQRRQQRSL